MHKDPCLPHGPHGTEGLTAPWTLPSSAYESSPTRSGMGSCHEFQGCQEKAGKQIDHEKMGFSNRNKGLQKCFHVNTADDVLLKN